MLLVTSSWLRKQNLLVFVNLTDIIPLEVAPTTVAVLLAGREFSAVIYLRLIRLIYTLETRSAITAVAEFFCDCKL